MFVWLSIAVHLVESSILKKYIEIIALEYKIMVNVSPLLEMYIFQGAHLD